MKSKIKMVLAASGNTYRSVAPAFGCDANTSASKVGRGLKTIKDLVKLCDYCEAKITITLKDGTTIPLTIEDFE